MLLVIDTNIIVSAIKSGIKKDSDDNLNLNHLFATNFTQLIHKVK